MGWDFFRVAIGSSLPPVAEVESEARMNNLLNAAVSGVLQIWLISKKDGDKSKPYGVMTTTRSDDAISGTKSFLIYTLYSIDGQLDRELIFESIDAMIEYAKRTGCDNIMAYSAVDSVINLAERFGGTANFRLLIKSLK